MKLIGVLSLATILLSAPNCRAETSTKSEPQKVEVIPKEDGQLNSLLNDLVAYYNDDEFTAVLNDGGTTYFRNLFEYIVQQNIKNPEIYGKQLKGTLELKNTKCNCPAHNAILFKEKLFLRLNCEISANYKIDGKFLDHNVKGEGLLTLTAPSLITISNKAGKESEKKPSITLKLRVTQLSQSVKTTGLAVEGMELKAFEGLMAKDMKSFVPQKLPRFVKTIEKLLFALSNERKVENALKWMLDHRKPKENQQKEREMLQEEREEN